MTEHYSKRKKWLSTIATVTKFSVAKMVDKITK
jgi:hypothetical protein